MAAKGYVVLTRTARPTSTARPSRKSSSTGTRGRLQGNHGGRAEGLKRASGREEARVNEEAAGTSHELDRHQTDPGGRRRVSQRRRSWMSSGTRDFTLFTPSWSRKNRPDPEVPARSPVVTVTIRRRFSSSRGRRNGEAMWKGAPRFRARRREEGRRWEVPGRESRGYPARDAVTPVERLRQIVNWFEKYLQGKAMPFTNSGGRDSRSAALSPPRSRARSRVARRRSKCDGSGRRGGRLAMESTARRAD